MSLKAVIFDLDGVITDTASYHYRAWKEVADIAGVIFDEKINERLKGVSRMKSLEIILENAHRSYSEDEKLRLTQEKNEIYVELLKFLTPAEILPGIVTFLHELSGAHILNGLYSASRNTDMILDKLKIRNCFDAVITGNDVQRTKPDPEGFLLAARYLGVPAYECAVIEDAAAGIQGAKAAGMLAVGIGEATVLTHADICLASTKYLDYDFFCSLS